MTAQRLRDAAAKVREAALAVQAYADDDKPRDRQWDNLDDVLRGLGFSEPPVALAVADWLDEFATTYLAWTDRPGAGPVADFPGLALADLFLGES